jgi:hypothetical protein
MISIAKCLEVMHSGATFSLKVVTYDKRRKDKSGKVLGCPSAVLVWGNLQKGKKVEMEREMTALERSMLGDPGQQLIRRKPNHADHYTRNIRIVIDGLPTESIIKIHPPLIVEFNGETTVP